LVKNKPLAMRVLHKSQKAMMRYKFFFDIIKKVCQNQLKNIKGGPYGQK